MNHPAQELPPSGQSSPRQPSSRMAGWRGRVLYVDDDPIFRQLAQMVLRRAGFQVTTVSDGVEALDLLRLDPHDLLVTDFHMPRLDGVELIRALRSAGVQIPAVLVSATLPDVPVDGLRRAGQAWALAKPFSIAQLEAAVAVALGPTSTGA